MADWLPIPSMGVQLTQVGIALLVVVGGVVGAVAVVDLTASGESLNAEQTEDHRSSTDDTAFEVTTTLDNGDTANVTRSVELVVGGEDDRVAVDRLTVTVPAEGTERITLSAPSEALTPGEHEYAIVSGDGATPLATGNVTLDPPAFTVDDARAEPVVRGETGTVAATVRNDGDFRGMRSVGLRLDADRDGTYDDETAATTATLIPAGGDAETTFAVRTDGLDPGTYAFRVSGTENAAEGTLRVMQPATVRIAETTMTTDVVRGDRFETSVVLVNRGDVAGTETIRLDGPTEAFDRNRTVTLDGGESTTVSFDVGTENVTRGNHSVALSVANESASSTLRLREGFLKVSDLRGPGSAAADEELRFAATLRNIGGAGANQTVEHRIDLDGDDDPEAVLGNRTVVLDPGNRTTVEFSVTPEETDRVDADDLIGTRVYGVYSEDTEATDVVVVRTVYTSSDSSSDGGSDGGDDGGDAGDDEPETVSKDVISQEKYGVDYDEVSGETQTQIDEIHERQPFADGLVITEVLTREEIARQEFGLDVGRNDAFDFTSIDVETQQEIEAEFDAQFESDDGDRIESWDELSLERFDSEYETLNESQQETVRERYQEQFES